jgi:hypothetical protein
MKRALVQKHTRINIYKPLARPILAYGCEARTINEKDENRITAAEVPFMMRKEACIKWDHKRNEEIMEHFKTEPVLEYIGKQRQN